MSIISCISIVCWHVALLFLTFTSASVKINGTEVENPIIRLVFGIPTLLLVFSIFLAIGFFTMAPFIEHFVPHLLSF